MIELKAPPHSTDAEQAVISAVLGQPACLLDIDLVPDQFYRRENRLIWQAIRELQDAGTPADALTLMDKLAASNQLDEAGGIEYLTSLAGSMMGATNVRHYASIVADKAAERRMIAAAHTIADMGYNPEGRSVAERVGVAQGLLVGLESHPADDGASVDDCMRETIAKLQAQWDRPEGMLGLSTGFADLDKRTQGLRRGDMIVIAGRPSQGKTTLAMNIAENVTLAGGFVIVFSLEMPRDALSQRMLASVGKVDHTRLQNGKMEDDEYSRVSSAAARIKGRALHIFDTTNLTSNQLLSRARRIAHKFGRKPDLVVVDYLQLLRDKGEGNARVEEISRNMKALARELDCPALILSQLNRGVEGRSDKRPLMSDLRDSGSIEQDADIIWMMYRDEYYDENTQHKGLAEVICRKYRNGKVGTDILSSAHLDQCRFDNSAVRHIEQAAPAKRASGFKHYAEA
jgi:replicative DNA helicase